MHSNSAPAVVYSLLQVGGVNSGRLFYISVTQSIEKTKKEHRSLDNVDTYGYIKALQEQGADFKLNISARRTTLGYAKAYAEKYIAGAMRENRHIVNDPAFRRLYLDHQVM